jgi:hypothetical protein
VGRGSSAVHTELVEDRSQMGMHRTFTQHKSVGDLGIAEPIGHQLKDVDLPGSQADRPALKLFLQKGYGVVGKTHGPFGVQLPPGLVRLQPGLIAEMSADLIRQL